MTELAVIMPTISGREDSRARAIAAYQRTLVGHSWELYLVADEPSWSRGCMVGAELACHDRAAYLHYTADDLEPLPGWWEAARAVLDSRGDDLLPAPRVWNHVQAGAWDNACDGLDGRPAPFTRIPCMRYDQHRRIGPWPDVDYASDVWVSMRARSLGITTINVYGYDFIHHWSQVRRTDTPAQLERARRYLEGVA